MKRMGCLASAHTCPTSSIKRLFQSLKLTRNCYFNPNVPVSLNLGAASSAGNAGPLGDEYTLAEWQVEYGFDVNAVEADPLFTDIGNDDFHLMAGSPCAGMGVFSGLVNPSNGDFNGDLIVDGNDFLLWQRDTAIGELSDWKNNFGADYSSVALNTSIPEPNTILLIFVGILCCGIQHGNLGWGSSSLMI